MKVHYPKLYNMAHLSLNVFTASKGSNNYILFKSSNNEEYNTPFNLDELKENIRI